MCLDDVPTYVGKAVHLRKRFELGYGNISPKNCFVGGQQTNCRLNKLILEAALKSQTIELFTTTCTDHDVLEMALISQLRPAWNLAGM